MICQLLSSVISLGLGTLYPAYRSYKAVRTKDVREYVKWMMYWVVFGLFKTAEEFTDVFLGFWFPFYFQIKIVMLIWILSPTTNGSSILFRKFVHPYLMKNEETIDKLLEHAQVQSYNTVVRMGHKALLYATNLVIESIAKAPHLMVAMVNFGQVAVEQRGRQPQPALEEIVDPVANLVDVDMADGEDDHREIMVNNDVLEEDMDPFDLGENNLRGGAMDFSSGDEDDFKLPEAKKKVKGKMDVGEIDMAMEVRNNTVGKLTVDVLKAWLKVQGVSASKMKKAELVEAVKEKIEN